MKIETYLLVCGKDILKTPVISKTGVLLINKGIIITENLKQSLIKFGINEVIIH